MQITTRHLGLRLQLDLNPEDTTEVVAAYNAQKHATAEHDPLWQATLAKYGSVVVLAVLDSQGLPAHCLDAVVRNELKAAAGSVEPPARRRGSEAG